MNRVVIVGASAGGLSTAEALRRAGHEGAITLVGDEAEPPYDRPPLSKHLLSGQWEPDRLTLRSGDELAALELELCLGVPAAGLDPGARSVLLADGAKVEYDALVVATGVRARRLPGTAGLAGVHTLRTVRDALALRARLRPGRRLVVVGAGFLGTEVAAVARGLGVEVTLVESARVPLAQAVGKAAGRFLARLHQEHGVEVRTGATVTGILSEAGGVTGVQLADAAGTSVVPADDVLVAIGCAPNTEWLADSGLTVQDGLVCDEFCGAAPGVYGVGDVARWYNPLFGTAMRVEHRTNAAEQAMAVARYVVRAEERRPFAPVPYFWSDQYDCKVQAHGYVRGHDEALVLDRDPARRRLLVAYRAGDRITGVLAAGVPPRTLRAWRAFVAARTPWEKALTGPSAA
ncbi:FAD-dependent oxidoreductase [Streptomyces sp. IMTB 2501]|uniref:NAD(P)/FAD-dependent oxidoreductase n=1 Tax=Streptomyces sp. IMTB 2501 TaxID=1776340 RepID=UPI00096C1F4C|nr:FAD-dependent oxidoreductase [Streptomyces sp. IMTB 2501]OLZ74879.1 FAD-dependent oxidoreductase [Streptomyces sp. IMTB 2501]